MLEIVWKYVSFKKYIIQQFYQMIIYILGNTTKEPIYENLEDTIRKSSNREANESQF